MCQYVISDYPLLLQRCEYKIYLPLTKDQLNGYITRELYRQNERYQGAMESRLTLEFQELQDWGVTTGMFLNFS